MKTNLWKFLKLRSVFGSALNFPASAVRQGFKITGFVQLMTNFSIARADIDI